MEQLCINPRRLDDGSMVACRDCWQCRVNRRNDWVGRCIAESKVSASCYFGTLTYGRDPEKFESDHPHAWTLHYEDVVLMLKRLRKQTALRGQALGLTGGVRYFCVGEYGTHKRRAHWHIVLFMKDCDPPNMKVGAERWLHGWQKTPDGVWGSRKLFWPHGFTHWQRADVASFRYACKYLTKDVDFVNEKGVGMSTQPPLGDAWFKRRAVAYAEQGLSPRDFFYSFPDVLDGNGWPVRFCLQGRMRQRFCRYFSQAWYLKHGNLDWPQSEAMDDWWQSELVEAMGPEDLGMFGARMRARGKERYGAWRNGIVRDVSGQLRPLRLVEKPEERVRREFLTAWFRAVEEKLSPLST